MSVQYIQFDSTYRDRNCFPNPGQFDIPISQTTKANTLATAIDPISLEMPVVFYSPTGINATGTIQPTNTNNPNNLILCIPDTQSIERTANYYRGIHLNIADGGSGTIVKIESWDFLNEDTVSATGSDYFRVEFSPSISNVLYDSFGVATLVSSTDFTNGLVFVPNGVRTSQFYKDWFVYNETKNESSQILSYDGGNSLASIAIDATTTAWAETDVISIRQQNPATFGTFQVGSTTSVVVLDATTIINANNTFLRITEAGTNNNVTRRILAYDSTTQQATLDSPLATAPVFGDTYELLTYTEDTVNGFTYIGTQLNQEKCYEVRLINVILPNLSIEDGGLVSFLSILLYSI